MTREFPQYFSPEALKHGRGRRWSKNDLDVINAIRMLHHSRQGKAAIEEQLAIGWRPASGSASDRADLSRMIMELGNLAEDVRTEQKDHEIKTGIKGGKLPKTSGLGGSLKSLYNAKDVFKH
jgi:hypothetical protein